MGKKEFLTLTLEIGCNFRSDYFALLVADFGVDFKFLNITMMRTEVCHNILVLSKYFNIVWHGYS